MNPTEDGTISEVDFAVLLIAYAGFPETKKARMVKRVKKAYPRKAFLSSVEEAKDANGVDAKKCDVTKDADDDAKHKRGITASDYEMFYKFLQNINDVDLALTFFKYGQGIDKATLKHAANTVAHVQLRDHLIDVIFTLFDEDRKF